MIATQDDWIAKISLIAPDIAPSDESGRHYRGTCPACDKTGSLHVMRVGRATMVNCAAGCTTEAIGTAANFDLSRLTPPPPNRLRSRQKNKSRRNGRRRAQAPTTILPLETEHIPGELRALRQWVLWASVPGDDSTKKPRKLPKQANGADAKTNDPATWCTYDEALAAHQHGRTAGIGFVFAADDSFCGIDLDDSLTDSGALKPWAAEIIWRLGSTYAEVSPSGTGVKVWVRGSLPVGESGKKRSWRDGAVELYTERRFFAITGHRLDGCPSTIGEAQDAIDWIWATIIAPPDRNGQRPSRNGHSSGGVAGDRQRVIERAAKYLAKVPPAVSGSGGHNATYHAACCLVQGFALSIDEAYPVFQQWNQRCEPPWSEHDLHRKLTEAKKAPGERGHLLGEHTANGHAGAFSRHDHDDDSSENERDRALAEIRALDHPLATQEGRTELANAQRFATEHWEDIRWCDPWQKWLVWDGKRWAVDQQRKVELLAKTSALTMWNTLGDLARHLDDNTIGAITQFVKASTTARGIAATLSLSRSEPDIPILPEQLDRDPWLLNLANGTLDLRTFEMLPHCREHYLTKISPTSLDTDAQCPSFLRFLYEIMAGDSELIGFLQRAFGYCLTGVVRDHVLLFFYGQGANGKSTLLNAVLDVLGPDYAMKAPSDLLLIKHGDAHPTERADLLGKRLVACVEVDDGRRLAESLTKELTGGDKIRARRMRENFFEFAPTHKLLLAANHRPVVRGTDNGIWRRIKLVPFEVQFEDERQDRQLPEKLAAEASGILNWMILGCAEWQASGLREPNVVKDATRQYRDEADVIGQFISECCYVAQRAASAASELFTSYKRWCDRVGEHPVNQTRFGKQLTERGFYSEKIAGRVMRFGIALTNEHALHEATQDSSG